MKLTVNQSVQMEVSSSISKHDMENANRSPQYKLVMALEKSCDQVSLSLILLPPLKYS